MNDRPTVLVVRYRNPEIEDRCLSSLIETTVGSYDLVVIDNSEDDVSLSIIWNRWLERVGGRVCLLNSDTVLKDGGWLQKLCEPFSKFEQVLATGPSTNSCGTAQACGQSSQKEEYVDRMLSGFCLVVDAREVLELGGFDETAPFYGQESELLLRGRNAGMKTLWRTDVFVYHEGAATANKFLDVSAEKAKGKAWYQGMKR